MQRNDLYVLATICFTGWFWWGIVSAITSGPTFTILGSNTYLGYLTILILVISVYTIFSVFSICIKCVQDILNKREENLNLEKLSGTLPHLLILIGLYSTLLLIHTLWYMLYGY
jgi:hypothetical protein